MDAKIKLLIRHGYKLDDETMCYVKEWKWNKKIVWKSFISRSMLRYMDELEVYRRIKSNDEHGRDYIKNYY